MQELPPSGPGHALETRPGETLARQEALARSEARTRRRNRRWAAFVIVPSVLLGAAGLAAAIVAGNASSGVSPGRAPAGYHAVSDGVFAYAVPEGWRQDDAYTDDVGDLDTAGPGGWAAEHLGVQATRPGPQAAPPSVFRDFGLSRPAPYTVTAARPVAVPGATVAYRFDVVRPGGFEATAVHAWQAGSGADFWLLVRAPSRTTAAILQTLRA